jgi:histidinol-phosphate/aromatic aminotransferase/cobyric acid decarboxylase-like protein/SAM-dependent methyltransferase
MAADAPVPWYRTFFDRSYWSFARFEYDDERTAAEVGYLRGVIAAAPGRRVIDLGSGTGRHAVALAGAGYDVVGLDVASEAVDEARRRARAAGVRARFEVADLLGTAPWPAGPADAVICVQAFGWASDADQRRLLRRAHDHLVPGGVLILDHSNLYWILRHFEPDQRVRLGTVEYGFARRFDASTTRLRGHLRAGPAGRAGTRREHDFRLYSPHEASDLVSSCGFDVERLDADFVAGAPVEMDTRYVQVVARRREEVPRSLAVHRSAGSGPAAPPGDNGVLDLSVNGDEATVVGGAVREVWAALLAEPDVLDVARRYAMEDPYGGCRAAPVLSDRFAVPLHPDQVTAGAGAVGLVHGLAGLADGGTLLRVLPGFDDCAVWARARGAALEQAAITAGIDELIQLSHRCRPAVLKLDRPDLAGAAPDRAALRRLARAVSELGTVLLIDESAGWYLDDESSAVADVAALDNLIVLRSMAKGHWAGGLRVGFAIASPALARRVRSLLPPLAVSELPFAFALRLLERSDIIPPLRLAVRRARPAFDRILAGAGIRPWPGHPLVPWVLVPDPAGALAARLARLHIRPRSVPGPAAGGGALRLAVPILPERLTDLEARLCGSTT